MKKMISLLLVGFLFSSCEEEEIGLGTGKFYVAGWEYSGPGVKIENEDCAAGNIVSVALEEKDIYLFVFNMPEAASGSFRVGSRSDGTCALKIGIKHGAKNYYSLSGTLTKTGARKYNYIITMYSDFSDDFYTSQGEGSY
ncbi:hypothetical protein Lbys_1548 [Leadbetterella byssophila DSM 17132]|jgi:hypothetical protein|uniref:Lipoprotein n=1 Tax=Leadbetterella byssophila (strain DSM 17132 / JCM 16389 / KACC 11308 / NBRC 106382 / 4M15) TaxID=649349 RepID=E4RXM3_LEAB4|nr:hypothetical protein [Leadbetterella byssophila]ADQ17258.1 hypothetical protein Lbys_1548 [Leadbetterella byssophila DSM 17132]